MKKMIKAAKQPSATEEVVRVLEVFETEGVSKEEIFSYFLDRLTSQEALNILEDYADVCGIDLYQSASGTRRPSHSDSVRAYNLLAKMDPEKVAYVRKCYNDVLKAYNDYDPWDEDESNMHALNVNTIKTDWLIGAIEDDLMDEDEFNRIYDLLETAGIEDAAAYS